MSFNLARSGSLPNLMPPYAANCRFLPEHAANCQIALARCASQCFAAISETGSVSPVLRPVRGAWITRREAGKAP
jgi:hypothetical protein